MKEISEKPLSFTISHHLDIGKKEVTAWAQLMELQTKTITLGFNNQWKFNIGLRMQALHVGHLGWKKKQQAPRL